MENRYIDVVCGFRFNDSRFCSEKTDTILYLNNDYTSSYFSHTIKGMFYAATTVSKGVFNVCLTKSVCKCFEFTHSAVNYIVNDFNTKTKKKI